MMLYLTSFAKLIFPLLTLPYLARVLSVECYGVVSYVKAIVSYEQLVIDFGFILSSVKDIVNASKDKMKISYILGDTIVAKLMLSAVSMLTVLIMCVCVDIMRENIIYTILACCVPIFSSFLLDFFFRGIEKMQHFTWIYCFMKAVSTVCTILLIKNDSQVMLIPILDIISSFFAIVLTYFVIVRMGYRFKFSGVKKCIQMLKSSFSYFLNSMASTAFAHLNTVIIGIMIKDMEQIAYWSICVQLVSSVQGLYGPISNGIYPHMIRTKELKFIKKVLLICMPVVCLGTAFCYVCAPYILDIVGGEKYIAASQIFRTLSPVLILSFVVGIFGWPALGAIDKVKETTNSTIFGALIQIGGLGFLVCINRFTVINIAVLRSVSEISMLLLRMYYVKKYKSYFNNL